MILVSQWAAWSEVFCFHLDWCYWFIFWQELSENDQHINCQKHEGQKRTTGSITDTLPGNNGRCSGIPLDLWETSAGPLNRECLFCHFLFVSAFFPQHFANRVLMTSSLQQNQSAVFHYCTFVEQKSLQKVVYCCVKKHTWFIQCT